jgi:hypothetical protein
MWAVEDLGQKGLKSRLEAKNSPKSQKRVFFGHFIGTPHEKAP